MIRFISAILLSFVLTAHADTQRSEAAPNAKAYIVSPVDGAVVNHEFKVVFGLSHMGVAPAGVEKKHTGHHHLLINVDELPDLTKPLPMTKKIRHFGGGQTEAMITLPPGKHTLQLVLGDHMHQPHDQPVISEKITITVK